MKVCWHHSINGSFPCSLLRKDAWRVAGQAVKKMSRQCMPESACEIRQSGMLSCPRCSAHQIGHQNPFRMTALAWQSEHPHPVSPPSLVLSGCWGSLITVHSALSSCIDAPVGSCWTWPSKIMQPHAPSNLGVQVIKKLLYPLRKIRVQSMAMRSLDNSMWTGSSSRSGLRSGAYSSGTWSAAMIICCT